MNKFYNPDTMPPPASRYQQIAEVPGGSKLVLISGQLGLRLDGTIADDFEGQAEQAYRNVLAGLAAVGMGPKDLVRINTFLLHQTDIPKIRKIRESFLGDHQCASTTLVVAGLAQPGWLVEIEAIAAKD